MEGMITTKMHDQFDCGMACLEYTTPFTYERLKEVWGWRNYNDIRDNLLDSPYHHDTVLSRLGVKHLTVDANDIMDGKCDLNKTVILLHFSKEPEVRNFLSFLDQSIQATLQQHWVVLNMVGNGFVQVHWGDGQCRPIPFQTFKKMYTDGFPNCAYIVGKGSTYLPWYAKLYARITGKFYSMLGKK